MPLVGGIVLICTWPKCYVTLDHSIFISPDWRHQAKTDWWLTIFYIIYFNFITILMLFRLRKSHVIAVEIHWLIDCHTWLEPMWHEVSENVVENQFCMSSQGGILILWTKPPSSLISQKLVFWRNLEIVASKQSFEYVCLWTKIFLASQLTSVVNSFDRE